MANVKDTAISFSGSFEVAFTEYEVSLPLRLSEDFEEDRIVVSGELDGFPVRGVRQDDRVELKIFNRPEPESDTGRGEQTGRSLELTFSKDILTGRFSAKDAASALSDVAVRADTSESTLSVWSIICDMIDSIVGDLLDITDIPIRPMSVCSPKVGASGAFVLGHEGPGSHDMFTQTVYFPYHIAACGGQHYSFGARLGDSISSIDDLIAELEGAEWLLKHIGLSNVAELIDEVRAFYNDYGHFAVSLFFSSESRDWDILINANNPIPVPSFATTIKAALEEIGSVVRIHHTGKKPGSAPVYIGDGRVKHYLHRGLLPTPFTCATPLLVMYLFGTCNVSYVD